MRSAAASCRRASATTTAGLRRILQESASTIRILQEGVCRARARSPHGRRSRRPSSPSHSTERSRTLMIRPRRSCFTTRATKFVSILLAVCETRSREIGSNPDPPIPGMDQASPLNLNGWAIACGANRDPNAADGDRVGFTFLAQTGRPRDAEDGF
eukprot:9493767-Pyramimonas_sp.AAC.1